jgi:Zn finger protein HypA/HybF involved in hydrogenase expression
MDIRDAKPIGTKCVSCQGQANVLIEGWTPDGPTEESPWTCPRCHAANTILVSGKVVGVAILVAGRRPL